MSGNFVYLNQVGVWVNATQGMSMSENNVTNNTVRGVEFTYDSGSASLASNYICFNDLMDVYNANSTNNGTLDKCDNFYQWSEGGEAGCAKTCSEIWHIFYGNITGMLALAQSGDTLFMHQWTWNGTGKVYAANADETLHWGMMQALGRNSTGDNSTNDFEELDTLLGYSSIVSENVNATFSSDGSNPRETADFAVYANPVVYVPIANSTNSTAHRTGILWDMFGGAPQFNITARRWCS
jgi:hypothetical protein